MKISSEKSKNHREHRHRRRGAEAHQGPGAAAAAGRDARQRGEQPVEGQAGRVEIMNFHEFSSKTVRKTTNLI